MYGSLSRPKTVVALAIAAVGLLAPSTTGAVSLLEFEGSLVPGSILPPSAPGERLTLELRVTRLHAGVGLTWDPEAIYSARLTGIVDRKLDYDLENVIIEHSSGEFEILEHAPGESESLVYLHGELRTFVVFFNLVHFSGAVEGALGFVGGSHLDELPITRFYSFGCTLWAVPGQEKLLATDGAVHLDRVNPVQPTTWSRIKAAFRK